jgi:hypothetical protein
VIVTHNVSTESRTVVMVVFKARVEAALRGRLSDAEGVRFDRRCGYWKVHGKKSATGAADAVSERNE